MTEIEELLSMDARKPETIKIEGVSRELIAKPANTLTMVRFAMQKEQGDPSSILYVVKDCIFTLEHQPLFSNIAEIAKVPLAIVSELFQKVMDLSEHQSTIEQKKSSSKTTQESKCVSDSALPHLATAVTGVK